MKRLKLGAINWDAALPKETYFGSFTCRNLGVSEYADRLPYFAKKKNDGFEILKRTPEDYDRELGYAVEAGVDFFAYCWYPDGEEDDFWRNEAEYSFLAPHFSELNHARKMYQKSPLREKIKMCAIIFCVHGYSESDIEKLCEAMKEDCYLKHQDRPVLMVFNGYNAEFINKVRSFMNSRGIDPFIAFIGTGSPNVEADYTAADAVTAYASCHGAKSFDQLTKMTFEDNKKRLGYRLKNIPLLSVGWNPTPRIARPCPWVSYKDTEYCQLPDKAELKRAFQGLYDFIDENREACDTELAIVFAWNEFEEGGYLCPTLSRDGTPNDRLLRDFAEVKKLFEKEN